jgi:electron transfer flavoprotein beta subunit
VTAVSGFEMGDGVVTCRRDVDGGSELLEMDLPGVITMTKGKFEPRYASLKGIMAAKRKPLDTKDAQGGEDRLEAKRLAYPPERPAGRVVGEGPEAASEVVRLLREEAKAL